MKTFTAITLLAINLLGQRVNASCWDGGPKPPDFPIQMVEHLLIAGYTLQVAEKPDPGKDARFVYSHKRNPSDPDCFTFEAKNNGDGTIKVDSVGAMDAWLRELMACDLGGHRDYGSMYYA
jgi:hypothetical protein